jgi:hypothetical protein
MYMMDCARLCTLGKRPQSSKAFLEAGAAAALGQTHEVREALVPLCHGAAEAEHLLRRLLLQGLHSAGRGRRSVVSTTMLRPTVVQPALHQHTIFHANNQRAVTDLADILAEAYNDLPQKHMEITDCQKPHDQQADNLYDCNKSLVLPSRLSPGCWRLPAAGLP